MKPVIIVAASSWIWWLVLPVLAWVLLTQIRYMVHQYNSVGWPVTDATLQKGPMGFVPIGNGKGKGTPASFVGYVFRVGGSQYTGLFALYGRSEDVERFNRNFPAGSIRVRYDPTNPGISYLKELNDPRFGPLTSTQNPQHLAQAPSFDLQDILDG